MEKLHLNAASQSSALQQANCPMECRVQRGRDGARGNSCGTNDFRRNGFVGAKHSLSMQKLIRHLSSNASPLRTGFSARSMPKFLDQSALQSSCKAAIEQTTLMRIKLVSWFPVEGYPPKVEFSLRDPFAGLSQSHPGQILAREKIS